MTISPTARWWRDAADAGHLEACNCLGACYRDGFGTGSPGGGLSVCPPGTQSQVTPAHAEHPGWYLEFESRVTQGCEGGSDGGPVDYGAGECASQARVRQLSLLKHPCENSFSSRVLREL